MSEARSKQRPVAARRRAGLWAAVCLAVASCTSVSQMQSRYEAGDESQYDKLLTVAGRLDYPYATRKAAVTALGEIGDPRAVTTLISILGEFNQRTTLQAEAMVALGLIGDPQAVTPIGRLLDRSLTNSGDELRLVAIPVLGQLGGTEAAEILLNALSYYDMTMLRSQMAVPKGVFTGDEQSMRALQDSLRRPQAFAAPGSELFAPQGQTGGLFGPNSGIGSHPLQIEDSTPKERALAHESLVRVGDPAVPVIQEHLSRRETTITLRNELSEIIQQIGGEQSPTTTDSGAESG